MKISYNVDAELLKPSRKTKETLLSEEMQAVKDFVDNSDQENIAFEYEDEETARKRRNHIATYSKRLGLPVKALLRGNKVIVIYVGEEDPEE